VSVPESLQIDEEGKARYSYALTLSLAPLASGMFPCLTPDAMNILISCASSKHRADHAEEALHFSAFQHQHQYIESLA